MGAKAPSLEQLRKLSDEQLLKLLVEEVSGGSDAHEFPLEVALRRERVIESPSALAVEILDPIFYKAQFEPRHYKLLDEVLAPWALGASVNLEGVTYDPTQYTGLLVLWPRGTLKSTLLRIFAQWLSIHRKLRLGEDARIMFCHQVLSKALEHSDAIRECARINKLWRQTLPEFSPPASQKDWDKIQFWRWPNWATTGATEFSFTLYGESSSKTGGHYTDRLIDDWETEESVTSPPMLDQSERRFKAMDNLRDRQRPYNPWIAVGTPYHFRGTYARLEKTGGWLVYKVPAHFGSPKAIFDLVGLDPRDKSDAAKIEKGLVELETKRAADINFPKSLSWRELYRSARSQKAETEGLGGGFNEYNCQLLLNPVPEAEQRFANGDMDAAWVDQIPSPQEMWVYLRCDPAISKKKTADEFVAGVIGVDWRGHRWYLDGWAGREKKPTEQVRKMFRLALSWKFRGYQVKNIGVESVAYQEALAELCRGGVPAREAEVDGEQITIMKSPCPVVSIERSGDMHKTERILQMSGPVERREVHIWKRNPIGRRLYDQHIQFPFGPDDILDTCRDGWEKTQKPPRPIGPDGIKPLHKDLQAILKTAMLGDGSQSEPRLVGGHHTLPKGPAIFRR